MAKAVFIQNPNSPYKDRPGEAYHFPKQYLGVVQQTIGDWIVLYEGRQGAFGYVAVQKVLDVVPDTVLPDHFFAMLDLGSLWAFETIVPRAGATGRAYESVLRKADGTPMSGGANVSAVRRLSEADFAAIVNHGLAPLSGPGSFPREGPLPEDMEPAMPGFAEQQAPFGEASLSEFRPDILTSRKHRDASFARQVKAAYGAVCAISGLSLRNGKGRPEVQAAHIRAVEYSGPDNVQNGIALSGTLHWMFDRRLISVAEDMSILISHNKVPAETVDRLIKPDQRLKLPDNRWHHPHPEYLKFHRDKYSGR